MRHDTEPTITLVAGSHFQHPFRDNVVTHRRISVIRLECESNINDITKILIRLKFKPMPDIAKTAAEMADAYRFG